VEAHRPSAAQLQALAAVDEIGIREKKILLAKKEEFIAFSK